jgi:hypothetical protein
MALALIFFSFVYMYEHSLAVLENCHWPQELPPAQISKNKNKKAEGVSALSYL